MHKLKCAARKQAAFKTKYAYIQTCMEAGIHLPNVYPRQTFCNT